MTKPFKDVFAFSLGGSRSVLPFAGMPAVADNHLNKAISDRIENAKACRGDVPRHSLATAQACLNGGNI